MIVNGIVLLCLLNQQLHFVWWLSFNSVCPILMELWWLSSKLEYRLKMELLFVYFSNSFETSGNWLGYLFVFESLDDTPLLSILISNLEFRLVDD